MSDKPASLSYLVNLKKQYSNSNSNSLESQRDSSNIAICNKQYKFYCNTRRNSSTYTERQALRRAEYIESKLGNPQGKLFYLKCAWNLCDAFLDDLLRRSLNKQQPAKYFCVAAKREMEKNDKNF